MSGGACKLLLCGGGGGGVIRMAMKAAPTDGELQVAGERLLSLLEVSRDLELGEYLGHDTQVAIIHTMDAIEDLGPDVEALLAAKKAPSASERKTICDAFEAADAALRPILVELTVGWETQ